MFLFVVITVLTFFFSDQQIIATNFGKNGGRLLTDYDNDWNDWVLKNASQTLQGPVTDDRFAEFQTLRSSVFTFEQLASLSFSVRSSYEITILFGRSNDTSQQYTINGSSTNWTNYTILPSSDGICFFINDLTVDKSVKFRFSQVEIRATNYTSFKIHDYPVRTAYHISKDPTILNISPEISHLNFYVYLCSYCTLEVYSTRGDKHLLSVLESDVPELWKPISFSLKNEPNIKLIRNTTNGRYDGYWSIDLRPSNKVISPSGDSTTNEKYIFLGRATCNCGFTGSLTNACQDDCQVAPRVEFSNVEVRNFSVMVYWNIVKNCRVRDFVIYFKNDTFRTTRFSYLLENLSLCTNYTISVAASTIDNDIGKKTNKTIEIKLVPLPPKLVAINLDATDGENLFFKIEFEKKNECDINELITSCHSNITSKPPLQSEEKSTLSSVDYSTMAKNLSCSSFTRNSAGDSSKYLFKMFTEETGVYNFVFTPPLGAQNPVEFYNISIIVHPVKNAYNETFSETMTVTHAFFSNTSLKYFKICYSGQRRGFSNDTGCVDTNGTSTEFFFHPLRKYSLNVTFVTNGFTLPPVFLPRFESGPGVPVVNTNLIPPTINGTTANFTLWKNMFSEVNGEIIFYALILMTQLVKPSRDFGFWNGSQETWPFLPENSTQLTPNFWNPFEDNNQKFVFIIDEHCHKEICCNFSLKRNNDYWLFVRALTRAAYKDSPLLFFRIEDVVDYKPKYVAYVTVTFFLLLLVSLILIYLYKNRNKTSRDETNQFSQFLSDKFIDRIKREYYNLPVGGKESPTIALLPVNVNKNRDPEKYLPYDSNRVVLNDLPGTDENFYQNKNHIIRNYINASYIDGFTRTKAYISAQGPKLYTIEDFWKMVWKDNIELIIMASNTVENDERICAAYWPATENEVFECRKMKIKLIRQRSYDFYNFRRFIVFYNNAERLISHFQIKWTPYSNSCYPNQFLPVIKFLQNGKISISSPILVHSGYGVGKTGVVILCDLALEMFKNKGKVNFFNLTKSLRKQRAFMVKDLEHYASAHYIVKEYIMDTNNPFKVKRDALKEQLEYVDILCRHDTILQKLISIGQTESNVVQVRRYQGSSKFLVSQEPTSENFSFFWTMVANESIQCIVFLNKQNPLDNSLYKGDNENIKLHFLRRGETTFFTLKMWMLEVYNANNHKFICRRKIFVYEFHEWNKEKMIPTSTGNFVELVKGVNELASTKQTLVLCNNGCTASGLFVVVSYIFDQFEAEFEIDVCSAIRVTRRSGRNFIESEEQLGYVYHCFDDFRSNSDSYANINYE